MIIIKNKKEIATMRTAGRVTGTILRDLADYIQPGMTTAEIDRYIEGRIIEEDMTPSFKGLYGFPAAACISVNEQIVHGIPSDEVVLKEGDIVSVDTGATYNGFVSDAARTYPVGEVSDVARRLIESAERSFFEGLKYCRKGCRLYDISHAIQQSVEADGFGVVRELVGHGVGRDMHEDPKIPNYGRAGRGPRLAAGMVFAIEPMITEGSYDIDILDDKWTYVTIDGGLSAHYENTVVINDGEPELLTLVK